MPAAFRRSLVIIVAPVSSALSNVSILVTALIPQPFLKRFVHCLDQIFRHMHGLIKLFSRWSIDL